jgi:DNA-directed RNA polymerase subunit RPC12/RpoP
MNELTNQECRDLKGSLSNRGCYLDAAGNPADLREEATSFICYDCGREFDLKHDNPATTIIQNRKAIVPVCFVCSMEKSRTE